MTIYFDWPWRLARCDTGAKFALYDAEKIGGLSD